MAILNQAHDIIEVVSSRVLRLMSGLKVALTLDGDQNATFGGDVTVPTDVTVGGNVVLGDESILLFGADETIGSWRITRLAEGDDLLVQRYEEVDEVGTWVTKLTILAVEV